jgi:antitoxin VapB
MKHFNLNKYTSLNLQTENCRYNSGVSIHISEEMQMALSIRNPRAERLAREVAARSGESLTVSIIHALEERLDRLKSRETAAHITEELLKISGRCRSLPDLDPRSPDEILNYDERGLPR